MNVCITDTYVHIISLYALYIYELTARHLKMYDCYSFKSV